MKSPANTHDTLVYRLSEILTKLNRGESLDPNELAEEFGVNLRTVQRDLNVRFAGLPLVKANGRYLMDHAYLGKFNISDLERFAKFSGVRGLFPDLSMQFIREVFNSNAKDAWLVMGHHYEDIQDQRPAFALLERAIVEKRYISFRYAKSDGSTKLRSNVEPYKLINQKGIWYLAAWDGGKLKSFAVSRIDGLISADSTFVPRPHVENDLINSDGIWLGSDRQEVLIQVSRHAATFFRRRNLLPNQTIEKEVRDGDLLISTTVVHSDEILPIIRYWIPHVRIIEPVEYQHLLERGLTDYLRRSEHPG